MGPRRLFASSSRSLKPAPLHVDAKPMTFPLAIGRGTCSGCETQLVVIEHALAHAIPDEARAEAIRAVVTIGRGEQLVVADADGAFVCPVGGQSGRLHALSMS